MNIFDFLKPKKRELFTGGSGESFETAIILNTPNYNIGIKAQSEFISAQLGERNKDWKMKGQALARREGKHFDIITIELRDGSAKEFYFDISQFYGKF